MADVFFISACADDPYIKFNNKFRSLNEGTIVNLKKAMRFGSKEDECKFECLVDNMCREVQYRFKTIILFINQHKF